MVRARTRITIQWIFSRPWSPWDQASHLLKYWYLTSALNDHLACIWRFNFKKWFCTQALKSKKDRGFRTWMLRWVIWSTTAAGFLVSGVCECFLHRAVVRVKWGVLPSAWHTEWLSLCYGLLVPYSLFSVIIFFYYAKILNVFTYRQNCTVNHHMPNTQHQQLSAHGPLYLNLCLLSSAIILKEMSNILSFHLSIRQHVSLKNKG